MLPFENEWENQAAEVSCSILSLFRDTWTSLIEKKNKTLQSLLQKIFYNEIKCLLILL